jgi:hypothetical protein
MRSVSPSLRLALEDSDFVFDGSAPWKPESAIDLAAQKGGEGQIAVALRGLEEAMVPATPQWFGQRLPVLWTMFMAARGADARALTIWMAETAHLLSDLPHDIVAHSIDCAIKNASHGFIPSVGEIRTVADPLVSERTRQIERLRRMATALADPKATAQRERRRREQSVLRSSASENE